jgi:hypothetical protein
MKIIQSILIVDAGSAISSASYASVKGPMRFDPAWYSEAVGVYFEVSECYSINPATGKVALFDFNTNVMIPGSELDISSSAWTRQRSGDLSAELTSAKNLVVKVKRTSASNYVSIACAKLIIKQDQTLSSRKTATLIDLITQWSDAYAYWSSGGYLYEVKIPIDKFNGIKTTKFVCYLESPAGSLAQARLYDVTAGAEVAGSLLQSSVVPKTLCESGDITLDSTHLYRAEVKSQSSLYTAYLWTAHIRIEQTDFSKVAALAGHFGYDDVYPAGSYINQAGYMLCEPGDISALDALSFAIRWPWFFQEYHLHTVHARIFDQTNGVAIDNTTHTETHSAPTHGQYDDVVSLPELDALLINQRDQAADYRAKLCRLYAYMEEALPPPPPTGGPHFPRKNFRLGYNCFVSQYVINKKGGFTPWKTPTTLY